MGVVTLQVVHVGLLVEAGLLKGEGVNDVVDLHFLVINILFLFLGGSVGANVWELPTLSATLSCFVHFKANRRVQNWYPVVRTDLDCTNGNHGTVNLVDDTVNLLEGKGVRDELVTGDDVLAAKLKLVAFAQLCPQFDSASWLTARTLEDIHIYLVNDHLDD